MKKASSSNGKLHLFEDVDVRRATGPGEPTSATSKCGSLTVENSTFTAVSEPVSELGGVCDRCRSQVSDEDADEDETDPTEDEPEDAEEGGDTEPARHGVAEPDTDAGAMEVSEEMDIVGEDPTDGAADGDDEA